MNLSVLDENILGKWSTSAPLKFLSGSVRDVEGLR